MAQTLLPAAGAFLITPSNTANLTAVTRGISFAAAGTLHVIMADGTEIILPDGTLAAGIIHPLQVRKVFAADTTVTGIVGYT